MDTEREYITPARKVALEAELEVLRGPRRKEILTQLEYAKALGDLSENAEYHEARELQGKNEDRIRHVEHLLKTSIVIDQQKGRDIVGIGCAVLVRKDSGEEKRFCIVGSEETDILSGKISHHSPIGSALFGKRVGDTFTIDTPKGPVAYTVTSIE